MCSKLAVMVLALAACGDVCVRNSDCGPGLTCGAEGHCVAVPVDAGVGDGAAEDARPAADEDGAPAENTDAGDLSPSSADLFSADDGVLTDGSSSTD